MRLFAGIWFLLFVSLSLASAEIRIKVVDPQNTAVAGAQVSLYRQGEASPLQIRITSGEGETIFDLQSATGLRAQVLAPGFAPVWREVENSSSSATLVKLAVAPASETVIVSATRTPTPEQETASSVSLLSLTKKAGASKRKSLLSQSHNDHDPASPLRVAQQGGGGRSSACDAKAGGGNQKFSA